MDSKKYEELNEDDKLWNLLIDSLIPYENSELIDTLYSGRGPYTEEIIPVYAYSVEIPKKVLIENGYDPKDVIEYLSENNYEWADELLITTDNRASEIQDIEIKETPTSIIITQTYFGTPEKI